MKYPFTDKMCTSKCKLGVDRSSQGHGAQFILHMEHSESSFPTRVICQGEGKGRDILLSEVISVGETAECQCF